MTKEEQEKWDKWLDENCKLFTGRIKIRCKKCNQWYYI